MKRWILVPVGACLILVLVVTACTTKSVQPAGQANQTPIVYAAVGASETFGVGADDPLKQAWPQVFSREAFPGGTVHNFGIPGATVAEALRDELPKALAIRPNLVTVWLNMNEMVDTYNAAIARVVAREGVELVNLRSGDFLIGQHPEWVSPDGFHPNTRGYEVIAGFFEKAYKSRSKAA